MNKHTWLLATVLALAVATPALAQYSSQFDVHSDYTYSYGDPLASAFRYKPFRFQIEGGPTISQRTAATDLDNGWNAGAGITWYPIKSWPIGLRADASFSKFSARQALLTQAAAQAQTALNSGTVKRWGGDTDAELDLPLGPHARLYFLAGVGWYKSQATYRQSQDMSAQFCSWWGCAPGYITTDPIVYRQTSNTQIAKNAGVGLEFAVAPGATFFVDARYTRIGPSWARYDYIPVRFGLRF